MKILAKLVGGSHLYGLNTPASDYDERYIYMHDDIANIVGLDKNECIDSRNSIEDKLGFEVRRYLRLLRKTNTQVVEMLFADESEFTELHPFFKTIRANRYSLIDQNQFYKSMKGYIQGETRLANGERRGKLGGKRVEQLDKYGFSPNNFVQLIRLCYCGRQFFNDGNYPVKISKSDPILAEELIQLKTHPENFNKDFLNKRVAEMEVSLDKEYEARIGHRPAVSHFDSVLANQMLFDMYYPMLGKILATQNSIC